MPVSIAKNSPKALCIDLETASKDALKVYQLAAWRMDSKQHVVSGGKTVDFDRLRSQLDELTDGAVFLLGHNIVRHDLPVLKKLCPALRLHTLHIVDTLELSPVAFPKNPYHKLVKDYKLVRESRNDPLADAKLAASLWQDQLQALSNLQQSEPDRVAAYHFLIGDDAGLNRFFTYIRDKFAPSAQWFNDHLPALTANKVCPAQQQTLLPQLLNDAGQRRAFLYTLAWLGVSGKNSVLPPWVRMQYPLVKQQIKLLRETSCGHNDCPYCGKYLNLRRALQHYFNYPDFRPDPPDEYDGSSLQGNIARLADNGQSVLAILPTGGGKSICYQLPALQQYWRTGALTVVVSPLQSLMKDQVDGLEAFGIKSAATLNGLLSMPERQVVLGKIRMGDVSILLVSPEQFRNPAFLNAIRLREIAAWVFDEAHCLSRWGHDFRPDYLYVTRYIREHYPTPRAPVQAFTATAKAEVIDDLKAHFRTALDIELITKNGGVERKNLNYDVLEVEANSKWPAVHQLLRETLPDEQSGGAVVFVARRKSAEEIAGFLCDQQWACSHYHGGLDATDKKDIQTRFVGGALQVIVATNAFGMGVDKPDVRLVIHAEIPGSLENYLQEAGRAGRDQNTARCTLLYCKDDIETQFGLAQRSKLTPRDIADILFRLKTHKKRLNSDEMVLTSGEILNIATDEKNDTDCSIDKNDSNADTKVRTALHWLEQAHLLERDENQTQVFSASLNINSLEEGLEKLNRANLPQERQDDYLRVLDYLINNDDEQGISTDDMTQQLGLSADDCIRALRELEKLKLLSNDISIACLLHKGTVHSSAPRLKRLCAQETALIALMRQSAPDAATERDTWQDMSLRAVCQQLHEQDQGDITPETVMQLLHSLGRPLGVRPEYLRCKLSQREHLRIRLLCSWQILEEVSRRRQTIASLLLNHLLACLPGDSPQGSHRVTVRMGDLADALSQDLTLAAERRDSVEWELTAVNVGLVFLHDLQIITLDKGKAIFRSAMHIRLTGYSHGRGFRKTDYKPLQDYYDDRTMQIHVMHEYARLGLLKMRDALGFVFDYFRQPKQDFIQRYFPQQEETLHRAATQESWQEIVGSLGSPAQTDLVCANSERNLLVLAGPGSGKTRVIVHRAAWLTRIEGERPDSILILAYNRSAADEIRQRLLKLLGRQAWGITVLTYHALALRLTGRTLADAEGDAEEIFRTLLDQACALLQTPEQDSGGDSLREQLLRGYRYILVDEYQDIDRQQYALISALAGRTLNDAEARLTLMAVGDDDQNIYEFRETSNAFIQRFTDDYQAHPAYLVDNYRSSAHIIAVANALIADNPNRLKQTHPVSIDPRRARLPAGGRWETLDSVARGRVQLLDVPGDTLGQAQAIIAEIHRRQTLDSQIDWGDIAILSPTHQQLSPLVAWCESEFIPYQKREGSADPRPALHQTREGKCLLDTLHAADRPLALATLAEDYRRQSVTNPDNDWLALCAQFWREQLAIWGDETLAAATLIDAFYDFSRDARRERGHALTLSTIHQAKGGQWPQVFVLDGGHYWQRPTADKRRLFYVAMTRAAELLTLCRSQPSNHPMLIKLARHPSVVTENAVNQPPAPPAWQMRYITLGMNGVYLSYAGKRPPTDPVHRALNALQCGDALQLREDNGKYWLYDGNGIRLTRLSESAKRDLPPGRIISIQVDSLVWRRHDDDHSVLLCEGWWLPLPRLIIAIDE